MRGGARIGGAALVAALVSSGPAAAQPCWSPAEAGAAQVRELQSMLMVAALRCRAGGVDILADYDALLRAERPAFAAAGATLRDHFAAGAANADGYDQFATMLANAYGDGGSRELGCDAAVGLMHAAAAAPDATALLRLASASVAPRDLPGGVCDRPGGAQPVTPAPEVVALAETPTRIASTAP